MDWIYRPSNLPKGSTVTIPIESEDLWTVFGPSQDHTRHAVADFIDDEAHARLIAAAPQLAAALARIEEMTTGTTWVNPEYKLEAINTIALAALAAAEGKE